MTTRRTPLHRALKPRVTPAALALWTRLREIEDEGTHRRNEPLGRKREYDEASRELDRAFGIKPWAPSIREVRGPEPPDYMRSGGLINGLEGWQKAWELRCALEKATRAETVRQLRPVPAVRSRPT